MSHPHAPETASSISMSCETCRRHLPAYAAGELLAGAADAVQAHVTACTACRQALSAHRAGGWRLVGPALPGVGVAGRSDRSRGRSMLRLRAVGRGSLAVAGLAGLAAAWVVLGGSSRAPVVPAAALPASAPGPGARPATEAATVPVVTLSPAAGRVPLPGSTGRGADLATVGPDGGSTTGVDDGSVGSPGDQPAGDQGHPTKPSGGGPGAATPPAGQPSSPGRPSSPGTPTTGGPTPGTTSAGPPSTGTPPATDAPPSTDPPPPSGG